MLVVNGRFLHAAGLVTRWQREGGTARAWGVETRFYVPFFVLVGLTFTRFGYNERKSSFTQIGKLGTWVYLGTREYVVVDHCEYFWGYFNSSSTVFYSSWSFYVCLRCVEELVFDVICRTLSKCWDVKAPSFQTVFKKPKNEYSRDPRGRLLTSF